MKRLLFMVLIAGLGAAGCRSAPVERAATPASPPAQVKAPPSAAAPPEGMKVVKLATKVAPELLPSRDEGRRRGHQNCPQTRLQEFFGVHFSRPHGCVVAGVQRGSLAEQAGLKAGDSIIECNGERVTCPASLLPRLSLGKEPGAIELTVLRPVEADDTGAAD